MRTKIRKALCAALSGVLIAGLLPAGAGAVSVPYNDVSSGSWYAEAVQYVTASSLMAGVESGTFGPTLSTTRGQIVTILYRLAGQPAVTGRAPFLDVTVSSYCHDAVLWANANGIASGAGDGTFNPAGTVTREQMATMFYRYAAIQGCDLTMSADLTVFEDSWMISKYAVAPMSWAVGAGLMNGTDAATVSPRAVTTRAALATTLMRFCDMCGMAAPETTVSVTVASAAPAPAEPSAPAVPVSGDLVSCVTVDGTTVFTPKMTFQWPIQGAVSSSYGLRFIFGSESFHRGIDISAPAGIGVHAGEAGTVLFAGEKGSYGNLVIIDHGNGFQSYYGHNTTLLVNEGDVVQKNQVIASVGATGRATGNHCHFEVHYKGQVVDPFNYLPKKNDAPANQVVAIAVGAELPDLDREAMILASVY
jgi:hypothetical protein